MKTKMLMGGTANLMSLQIGIVAVYSIRSLNS